MDIRFCRIEKRNRERKIYGGKAESDVVKKRKNAVNRPSGGGLNKFSYRGDGEVLQNKRSRSYKEDRNKKCESSAECFYQRNAFRTGVNPEYSVCNFFHSLPPPRKIEGKHRKPTEFSSVYQYYCITKEQTLQSFFFDRICLFAQKKQLFLRKKEKRPSAEGRKFVCLRKTYSCERITTDLSNSILNVKSCGCSSKFCNLISREKCPSEPFNVSESHQNSLPFLNFL